MPVSLKAERMCGLRILLMFIIPLLAVFFWHIGQINMCIGSLIMFPVYAHQRSAMLSVAILFRQRIERVM